MVHHGRDYVSEVGAIGYVARGVTFAAMAWQPSR